MNYFRNLFASSIFVSPSPLNQNYRDNLQTLIPLNPNVNNVIKQYYDIYGTDLVFGGSYALHQYLIYNNQYVDWLPDDIDIFITTNSVDDFNNKTKMFDECSSLKLIKTNDPSKDPLPLAAPSATIGIFRNNASRCFDPPVEKCELST